MFIKCNAQTLLENINVVIKAISSRTTIPILECILLTAENGSFKMLANDLEMAIETNDIPAEIITEGKIALEAKMLSEIIRRLPNDDVYISTDENNITLIKCNKSQFKILGFTGEEFPSIQAVDKTAYYKIKASDFKNIIKRTIFSVSVDESKPVLTGELVQIRGDKLNIVAVDGYRVSFCSSEIEFCDNETEFVIPSKTLNEISKILQNNEDDYITIYFEKSHVLFEIEGFTIVSNILEGEFIKYEQIFTEDYKTIISVNRQELIMSLERASLIANRELKKSPIKLQIESENMVITSNTEAGTVREELNPVVDGDSIEIAFNPKYLTDALKAIEQEVVTLQFTTPLSPCIIKPVGSENSKYLVLPLRLNV